LGSGLGKAARLERNSESMQYRHLGPVKISIIGFGGWPIGGDSYGWVTRRDAVAALARAYDLGVNFIDTSDIYGRGRSEAIIGTYIRGRRDGIVLATKGGYVNYPERLQDFTRSHLVRALEGSLRRLKTEYVDVYFLHSPPGELLEEGEALTILEELRQVGKIRFRGVSVREPADAALLLTKHTEALDIIQVPFSLVDQRARRLGVLAQAKISQVGMVARSPLCSGLLAGKRIALDFAKMDHRAQRPKAELNYWMRAANTYGFLEKPGIRTMAQAALQFCSMPKEITAVIPGMKTLQQVEENVASLQASPLRDDELARIHEVEEELAEEGRVGGGRGGCRSRE
jgi:aryl-alcohol dehydrogenase-like predicted oxidoreductase